MAPTICEDDMEPHSYRNINRIRRHCSVINYLGRRTNRGDVRHNEVASSEGFKYNVRRGRGTSECRSMIKRYRCESRNSYHSDDSSDSIPNPMTFHNYAKRRRFSETEDESSTSSDSIDRSVSSTISSIEDSDQENIRINAINYSLPRNPLALYSPVSSTTDALALYHRLSKASPRYVNPFYQQDLMEIAMKTIILLQKNRSLHARLNQLKLETRAFVNSVMSNPENAKLRDTLNQSNEQSIEHSKVLAIKNE